MFSFYKKVNELKQIRERNERRKVSSVKALKMVFVKESAKTLLEYQLKNLYIKKLHEIYCSKKKKNLIVCMYE